jgi:hypothetical protein
MRPMKKRGIAKIGQLFVKIPAKIGIMVAAIRIQAEREGDG